MTGGVGVRTAQWSHLQHGLPCSAACMRIRNSMLGGATLYQRGGGRGGIRGKLFTIFSLVNYFPGILLRCTVGMAQGTHRTRSFLAGSGLLESLQGSCFDSRFNNVRLQPEKSCCFLVQLRPKKSGSRWLRDNSHSGHPFLFKRVNLRIRL